MEEFNDKRFIGFSIIGVILIIVSVFGVTYSFLSNKSSMSDKNMTIVKTDDLVVRYEKGTDIHIGNIKPGKIVSKTFIVKNSSTGALNYDIRWVYTENDFNEEDNLVYSITVDGKKHKEKDLPSTGLNIPIVKNITIEKNASHTYIINIRNKNNESSNKTNSFKGKIEVKLNKDNVKD